MTNTYHYCILIITAIAVNVCQQEVSSSFIVKPTNAYLTTQSSTHQQQRLFSSSTNTASTSCSSLDKENNDKQNSAENTVKIGLEDTANNVFLKDKRPVILFDGICNVCNSAVNFALDYDSIGTFRFASLQSKIGQSLLLKSGKEASDMSSIVLVTSSQSYFKSDAVVRIAKGLDPTSIKAMANVAQFVPAFIRNVIYDFVGTNRYIFGERDMCRIDDGEFEDRFIPDPL